MGVRDRDYMRRDDESPGWGKRLWSSLWTLGLLCLAVWVIIRIYEAFRQTHPR